MLRDGVDPKKVLNQPAKPPAGAPGTPPPGTTVSVPAQTGGEEEEDGDRRQGGSKLPDRGHRQQQRAKRAEERKKRVAVGAGGQVILDDDNYRHVKVRRGPAKRRLPGTVERKGKVPINEPITVRTLSEAVGMKVGKLLIELMKLGAAKGITINSVLDTDLAETVALEAGIELDIRKAADAEATLLAEREKNDADEHLEPRPPVVTIMGHVDHGKTSVLDYIRKSKIVDTEAGGITQVIRAWTVVHNGRKITFLDTPGHEAFTRMRARGAGVTDIAVIVVACNDGIMPQTEEAISHAKAAGVPIIVDINKIDLPNAAAGIAKCERQMYSLELLPEAMGGTTQFAYTSATTGKGIDDLLDRIILVSDYELELKANPNKLAVGTCLEASVEGNEGVFATLLVQEGTLHKGDILLCGSAYGRVRAMYDDLGRPIDEAGPSTPVRITGLDQVPDAGDKFHAVNELQIAREIAEKRREKIHEASLARRAPVTLESLGQGEKKITELKVIVKADFRGSVEAIRKELEKIQHEEARVRVLHTGIGGITEEDVFLALTSPQDTMIVGFNAVPDDKALALAEERGVMLREYNIIYNLTDDVKMALQGKLKPREEVIHLGRAVVRETFKISKVGTVAGCYVTQGTIERSAKVRLIRGGVVVYPPAERTVGLESLKRFKEDTGEVREGFECGIKIAGYDDIKVDDVIEAYRIEQVARTL
jgi:translation initiation factor IF-2